MWKAFSTAATLTPALSQRERELRAGLFMRRADLDHLFGLRGGQHEDLAVAHATGAGNLDDLTHDLLDPYVVDPQRDLHLGQKGQGVFAAGVLVEVALL